MVFYSRDKVAAGKGIKATLAAAPRSTTEKADSHFTDSTGDMDDGASESGSDDEDCYYEEEESSDGSSAPPADYYNVPIRTEKVQHLVPDSPSESGAFGSFDLVLPAGSLVSPLSLNESVTGLMLLSPDAIKVPFHQADGVGAKTAAAIRQRRSRLESVPQQRQRQSSTTSNTSRRLGNERLARKAAEEATLRPVGGRRLGDPLANSEHNFNKPKDRSQHRRTVVVPEEDEEEPQTTGGSWTNDPSMEPIGSDPGGKRRQQRPSNENVKMVMMSVFGGEKTSNTPTTTTSSSTTPTVKEDDTSTQKQPKSTRGFQSTRELSNSGHSASKTTSRISRAVSESSKKAPHSNRELLSKSSHGDTAHQRRQQQPNRESSLSKSAHTDASSSTNSSNNNQQQNNPRPERKRTGAPNLRAAQQQQQSGLGRSRSRSGERSTERSRSRSANGRPVVTDGGGESSSATTEGAKQPQQLQDAFTSSSNDCTSTLEDKAPVAPTRRSTRSRSTDTSSSRTSSRNAAAAPSGAGAEPLKDAPTRRSTRSRSTDTSSSRISSRNVDATLSESVAVVNDAPTRRSTRSRSTDTSSSRISSRNVDASSSESVAVVNDAPTRQRTRSRSVNRNDAAPGPLVNDAHTRRSTRSRSVNRNDVAPEAVVKDAPARRSTRSRSTDSSSLQIISRSVDAVTGAVVVNEDQSGAVTPPRSSVGSSSVPAVTTTEPSQPLQNVDGAPPSSPTNDRPRSSRTGSKERKPSSGSLSDGRGSSGSPSTSRRRLRTERNAIATEEDGANRKNNSGMASPRSMERRLRRRLRADRAHKAAEAVEQPPPPPALVDTADEKREGTDREVSRRPASQSPTAQRRRGVGEGLKRQVSGEGNALRRRVHRNISGDLYAGDDQSMDREEPIAAERDEPPPVKRPHQPASNSVDAKNGISESQVQGITDSGEKSSRPGFARSLFKRTGSIANIAKAMKASKKDEKNVFNAMQDQDSVDSLDDEFDSDQQELRHDGGNGRPSNDMSVKAPKANGAEAASSTMELVVEEPKPGSSPKPTTSPSRRQSTRKMVMEKSSALSSIASRALIYASAKKADKKSLLDDCVEHDEDTDDDSNHFALSASVEKENVVVDQRPLEKDKTKSAALGPHFGNTTTKPEASSLMDSFSDRASFSMDDKKTPIAGSLPTKVEEFSESASEEVDKAAWDASFSHRGDVGPGTGFSIDMAGRTRPAVRKSKSSDALPLPLFEEEARPSMQKTKSMSSTRKVASQATSVSNLLRYATAKKVETTSLLDSFSGTENQWEQKKTGPLGFSQEIEDNPTLASVVKGDAETEVSKWKKLSVASTFIHTTKAKAHEQDAKSNEMDWTVQSTGGVSSKWGALKQGVDTKNQTTTQRGIEEKVNAVQTSNSRKTTETNGVGHTKASIWTVDRNEKTTKYDEADRKSDRTSSEIDGTGHSASSGKSSKRGRLKKNRESGETTVDQGLNKDSGKSNEMDGTGHSMAAKSSKWGLLRKAPIHEDIPNGGKADSVDEHGSKWGKLGAGMNFIREGQKKVRRRRSRHKREGELSEEERNAPESTDDKMKRAMDLVAAVSRANAEGGMLSDEGGSLANESQPKKSEKSSKWDALRHGASARNESGTENVDVEVDKKKILVQTSDASKWSMLKVHATDQKLTSEVGSGHNSKWTKLSVSNDFIRQTKSRSEERRLRRLKERGGEDTGAPEQGHVEPERTSRQRLHRDTKGNGDVNPVESKTADQHPSSAESQGTERRPTTDMSSETSSRLPSTWAGLKGRIDTVKPRDEESTAAPSTSSNWTGLTNAMTVKDSTTSTTESEAPSSRTFSRTSTRRNWDKVKTTSDFIGEAQRRARASERRRQRRECTSTETTAMNETTKAAAPSIPSKWAGLQDAIAKDTNTTKPTSTEAVASTMPSTWAGLQNAGAKGTMPSITEAPAPSIPSQWAGLQSSVAKDVTPSSTDVPAPSSSRGAFSRTSSQRNWSKVKGSADFINETQRRAAASERRRQRRGVPSATDAIVTSTTATTPDKVEEKAREPRIRRLARSLSRPPSISKSSESAENGTSTEATMAGNGNDGSKWKELNITKLASSVPTESDASAPPLPEATEKPKSRWKALKGGIDFITMTKSKDNRKSERRQRREEKDSA
jgi:hypothetical protein